MPFSIVETNHKKKNTKIYKKNLFKVMRQIINNFTIIKLIEINFVVYVLRQKKNLIINFFFLLHLLFFFHKPQPFFFFFFGKQGNIINYKTLVAAPVLQSLGRQKPITSSAKGCTTTVCTFSQTLYSLQFSPYFLVNAQLSLSCCSHITKWPNGHN